MRQARIRSDILGNSALRLLKSIQSCSHLFRCDTQVPGTYASPPEHHLLTKRRSHANAAAGIGDVTDDETRLVDFLEHVFLHNLVNRTLAKTPVAPE